jgi:hypothetical protein
MEETYLESEVRSKGAGAFSEVLNVARNDIENPSERVSGVEDAHKKLAEAEFDLCFAPIRAGRN